MKIQHAHRSVSDAARPYESRWTLRALQSLDPDLHARFREQQDLWHAALVTGDDDEVREQTEAMCRGWSAICRRMEGQPDDSYLLGTDPRTGLKVAISAQQAAMDRVREVHGERVVWVTPDEVATLLSAQQGIASIKGAFPGAQLIDLYPEEIAA